MTTVDLRALVLPPRMSAEVLKLLATIEAAESILAVNMVAQCAEGFVLGLETAGVLHTDFTKGLCAGFATATRLRREALRDA
jgi:hypothetical protein